MLQWTAASAFGLVWGTGSGLASGDFEMVVPGLLYLVDCPLRVSALDGDPALRAGYLGAYNGCFVDAALFLVSL